MPFPGDPVCEQQGHARCFSTQLFWPRPLRTRWICRRCLAEGKDFIPPDAWNEYDALVLRKARLAPVRLVEGRTGDGGESC